LLELKVAADRQERCLIPHGDSFTGGTLKNNKGINLPGAGALKAAAAHPER